VRLVASELLRGHYGYPRWSTRWCFSLEFPISACYFGNVSFET